MNLKCVDPGTGKGLYNSSSACAAACTSPTPATGHPGERKILRALYNQTRQGDGWLDGCKIGWDPPTPNHCDPVNGWNGITCDSEGFVTKISLGGCGLKGVFPVPSIFTFTRAARPRQISSRWPPRASHRTSSLVIFEGSVR